MKTQIIIRFVFGLLIFSSTTLAAVKQYPANYYCELSNKDFLGEDFYQSTCGTPSIRLFAQNRPPINVPTAEFFEIDQVLPSTELINSVLNLLKLQNTFNGKEFYWASRAKAYKNDIQEVLSKPLFYSRSWEVSDLNNLVQYIDSSPYSQIYAIIYNDVMRGGSAETIYFVIYDPWKKTVLVVNRLLYLE